MEQDQKVDGYHLFYINCTTSKWNKTEMTWDQHCEFKDWKHPKNKDDKKNKKSSSDSDSKENKDKKSSSDSEEEEKPIEHGDKDFLKSQKAEPVPTEGRRLEDRHQEHREEHHENEHKDLLNKREKKHHDKIKCHHNHHHCRKHKIAYIIDGHCFMLSTPRNHHHRRHRHYGFCPFLALLRSIHCLSVLWLLVLIIGCIKKRCHRKKLNKLFRKLVKLENKDGNEIYLMLHRGFKEVEVHIKSNHIEAPTIEENIQ